jgi:hypothetical protein
MTFWVHIEADGENWVKARRFHPHSSPAVPGMEIPHAASRGG